MQWWFSHSKMVVRVHPTDQLWPVLVEFAFLMLACVFLVHFTDMKVRLSDNNVCE